MSEKIQTRLFNFGDENEGTWPPRYPSGEKGLFHVDRDTGQVLPGPPPPRNIRFGEAPYIIQDSMEPYRHPATGQVIDSKSALRQTDKACGTITTDKKLPPDPTWHKEQERKRHEDIREAMRKSIAQIDGGTAPLTEEVRELCAQQNEIVSKATGWDAYNVAGRKKDVRGKRFRSGGR